MARRYANALFDVAKKSQHLEQVERDLTTFSTLVETHPDLQRVFDTPAIAPQKKRALLDALLDRSGFDGEVRRLLEMLADRDRLGQLSGVAAAFADRLRQERHVLQAQIVTALPLEDAQRASLQGALRQASGAEVTMSERVDPAIIGGVVARVGSLVFDASVSRQLERLRQRLTEAGVTRTPEA
jgi:F-type H+-transporting ATPase subunit delta